jgi:hypothetical protein
MDLFSPEIDPYSQAKEQKRLASQQGVRRCAKREERRGRTSENGLSATRARWCLACMCTKGNTTLFNNIDQRQKSCAVATGRQSSGAFNFRKTIAHQFALMLGR